MLKVSLSESELKKVNCDLHTYSIFNRKVLEKYSRNLSQFQFQMPLEEVERRTLWVTVWHSDMFGRNDFLGEVMLPINTIPLDDPQPRWYSLQDRVSLL